MGFQVEDLGKNMMKLVIEASPEQFEEAVKMLSCRWQNSGLW